MPSTGGGVLAVVEKGGHALAFFDVQTGRRQTTLRLPEYPHEMVVDAKRRYAYIGHYGVRMSRQIGEGGAAVLVVDLQRRKLINTIDTRPYNRVHGMGIDSRNRVYALSEAKAQLMTLGHPASANQLTSIVPTGGEKTHMFALTGDGSRAYVSGLVSNTLSLVNPHDPKFVPRIVNPGAGPESVCLSPDERTLYVGARMSGTIVELDAITLEIRKTQHVSGDPLRVYARPDGCVLMANIVDNTLAMLSGDLTERWRLQLDGAPAGVSFHPTRPIAYVSQFCTNQIAVVDLDARRVLREFATNVEPDASAFLG